MPRISTANFLVFTPKWQVAQNTLRPPYYHRNVCTEIMGMVCGKWMLTNLLGPGGLTYEPSYAPWGESGVVEAGGTGATAGGRGESGIHGAHLGPCFIDEVCAGAVREPAEDSGACVG